MKPYIRFTFYNGPFSSFADEIMSCLVLHKKFSINESLPSLDLNGF